MNAKTLTVLALATLLSAPALASPRVLMDIDCSQRVRPSLQQFAADAGIDSANQAYALRSKAWLNAVRTCHRGADRVQVVLHADRAEPVLYVVQR